MHLQSILAQKSVFLRQVYVGGKQKKLKCFNVLYSCMVLWLLAPHFAAFIKKKASQ